VGTTATTPRPPPTPHPTPPCPHPLLCPQYLEECRISLLAGLKRHFRFKAAEGLLAKTSLRLLDYACDAALSQPQAPLNVWKEVRGGGSNKQHMATARNTGKAMA